MGALALVAAARTRARRRSDAATAGRFLAGRVEERTPHSHPVAQLARHCAVALCVASFVLPLGEYNEEEEAAGLAAAHPLRYG